MEGKNIDRLFQEKLKSLEATPNKEVWNNIESKLKKRKRRVLPMWWFSVGIAAVLILGFLLFPFSNNTINNTKKQPIIIATPEINTKNINSIKKESDTLINKKKEETILVEESKETNKLIQKKRVIKNEKRVFLIAKKIQKDIEKETKDSVSKRAMEKIFLTDNEFKNPFDSIKSKSLISQENVLDKSEKKNSAISKESTDIIKKLDSISTKKQKIIKPKQDFLFATKEKESDDKESAKKLWTVSPVIAVLNSNSFSNTSPIDVNLSNSTKGNSSYSYGVQVAYQLNNKWTIQSGIHLQEIRFSNTQIAVASTSSSTSNITFNSGDNFALEDASGININSSALSLSAISLDGDLEQKYGYIEIPIEVKYNLLESKRFKTQLIAGFSSLFLNKNAINLNANSFSRSGKATNLNSINFSGNLGFAFNYAFDKNWSLNLNPMIKAQLNTFNKSSNGFKPYFIGIYTGINYQF